MTPRQPPYAYVRSYYRVNPVPGERARFNDGREGVIARRQSYDQYVWIKFDNAPHAVPCHPTDLTYGIGAGGSANSVGTPEGVHPESSPTDQQGAETDV